MEFWTGFLGLSLAAVMAIQMAVILRRSEGSWRRTAKYYKIHFLGTVGIAFVSWLILFVLALSQPLVPAKSNFFNGFDFLFGSMSPALAAGGGLDSKWRTAATVILIAFLSGSIRLLFEQAADDPRKLPKFVRDFVSSFLRPRKLYDEVYRLDPKELGETSKHDSWVWWFVITVILAIVPDQIPFGQNERLRAIVVTSVAFVGYFTWIYIGLYNKLTKVHGFSGLASRAFLGDLLNQFVPLQAVVIGPRGAGKTCFIRAEVDDQEPTRDPTVHLFQAYLAKISVVDTPGENLGDHLLIVAKYRTDTLALVLDVRHLSDEGVNNRAFFTDRDCPMLFQEGTSSRKYLEQFISATKSDEFALPKREVFKVLSFLLFLNFREADREKYQNRFAAMKSDDRLQNLAKSLGRRFGVEPKDCCAVIAPAPQERIARRLIALEPEKRLESFDREKARSKTPLVETKPTETVFGK